MDLESRRALLEELDRIEEALVSRIVKSSEFIPPGVCKTTGRSISGNRRTYTARVNALRRWEARSLVNHYNQLLEKVSSCQTDEKCSPIEEELQRLDRVADDAPAVSLHDKYALHSDRRGLYRFTCEYTHALPGTIDNEYPPQEKYGQVVHLEPFYQDLIASSENDKPSSYRAYLLNIEKFASFAGVHLFLYLIAFNDRAYSLGRLTGTTAEEILQSETSDDGIPDSPTEYYCLVCAKAFANVNVYHAHLKSKKHRKALAAGEQICMRNDAVYTRSSLLYLLKHLKPVVSNTIAELDRKSGMSVQDRKLEAEALEREKEAEDNGHSDTEQAPNSDMPLEPSNEPRKTHRGPDGTPIPRWLFKLHGLGTVFRCEICGPNYNYSGRKAFAKHFNSAAHLSGLKKLGLNPIPALNGITSIEEARALIKKLERGNTATVVEKEVEDEDGNALSESMYEELKKQGLI